MSINILIDKLYAIIWFWLVILLIITFFNLISWIFELTQISQIEFLDKYIKIRMKMLRSILNKGNQFQIQSQDVDNLKMVVDFDENSHVTRKNLKKSIIHIYQMMVM